MPTPNQRTYNGGGDLSTNMFLAKPLDWLVGQDSPANEPLMLGVPRACLDASVVDKFSIGLFPMDAWPAAA